MIRNLEELSKQLAQAYTKRLQEITAVDKKHQPIIENRVFRLFKECFPKSEKEAVLYPMQGFRGAYNEFAASIGNPPLPDDIKFDKMIVVDRQVMFDQGEDGKIKALPATIVVIVVENGGNEENGKAVGQMHVPSMMIETYTSLIKTELIEPISGTEGKIIKLN